MLLKVHVDYLAQPMHLSHRCRGISERRLPEVRWTGETLFDFVRTLDGPCCSIIRLWSVETWRRFLRRWQAGAHGAVVDQSSLLSAPPRTARLPFLRRTLTNQYERAHHDIRLR